MLQYIMLPIIRYSFNKQIQILCNQLCYLAFGVNLHKQGVQNANKTNMNHYNALLNSVTYSNAFSPIYKCQVANDLYNFYREDNFKYCQPGITPKLIAQQIEVHMVNKGDLHWQIDQFGNFIFHPTSRYLQTIRNNLNNKKAYFHTTMQEFSQFKQRIGEQLHYFDYVVSHQPTIKQIRKIVDVNRRSKIIETISNKKVIRTVFVEQSHKLNQQQLNKYRDIFNVILGEKYQIADYDEMQRVIRQRPRSEGTQVYQYLGCDGQNSVFYNKILPNHKLYAHFCGNEQIKISSLSTQKLLEKIRESSNRLANDSKDGQKEKKGIRKLTVQQSILVYGNLIQQHNLQCIEQLLKYMIKWGYSSTNEYQILVQSFNAITNY